MRDEPTASCLPQDQDQHLIFATLERSRTREVLATLAVGTPPLELEREKIGANVIADGQWPWP